MEESSSIDYGQAGPGHKNSSEQPVIAFQPPPSRARTSIQPQHRRKKDVPSKIDDKDTETDSSDYKSSDRAVSFQDSPILDVIALVLSAGLLLAIVGLLQRYDGKRQPAWDHLSLNTVVAWLSTLSKGCILLLLGRSIGQLKFAWFAGSRQRISDLRTFDMASRGILGSLILLFKQKGRLVLLLCVRESAAHSLVGILYPSAVPPLSCLSPSSHSYRT